MPGSGEALLNGRELAVMFDVGGLRERTDEAVAGDLEMRGLLDLAEPRLTAAGILAVERAVRAGVQPETDKRVRIMVGDAGGGPGQGLEVTLPLGRMQRRAEVAKGLRAVLEGVELGTYDAVLGQIAGMDP